MLTAGSGADRGAVQGELVEDGEERKDSSFGELTREGGNTTHPIPPASVESAVHVSQKRPATSSSVHLDALTEKEMMEVVDKLNENRGACDRVARVYSCVLNAMPSCDPESVLMRLDARMERVIGDPGAAF